MLFYASNINSKSTLTNIFLLFYVNSTFIWSLQSNDIYATASYNYRWSPMPAVATTQSLIICSQSFVCKHWVWHSLLLSFQQLHHPSFLHWEVNKQPSLLLLFSSQPEKQSFTRVNPWKQEFSSANTYSDIMVHVYIVISCSRWRWRRRIK